MARVNSHQWGSQQAKVKAKLSSENLQIAQAFLETLYHLSLLLNPEKYSK